MILHLNGYPGTGKLTIAQAMMPLLGARLLDNHSVYNVALALTTFKSPEFYQTVEAVRRVAYDRVLDLPRDVPVILTNAHAEDSAWGQSCWDALLALAQARGGPLFLVTLEIDPDEHDRRVQGLSRVAHRKPRDPAMFPGNRDGRALLERGGDARLRLDVSDLSAEAAAQAIVAWVRAQG